jgi:shikimate 5-dehydrogenase
LPAGSLVVNATGLGKDRPGSPVTAEVRFPPAGLVWELNYRGSLEFLVSARNRQAADGLTVVDGWRYFVHGWSQVIAEVFGLRLDPATVQLLSDAAASVR